LKFSEFSMTALRPIDATPRRLFPLPGKAVSRQRRHAPNAEGGMR
jgi:hypothetical protein